MSLTSRLLLFFSDDSSLIAGYAASNQDGDADLLNSGGTQNDLLAQSFQSSRAITVSRVRCYLKKVALPPGYLTVKIYDDSAGDPNALIANGEASTRIDDNDITGSYAWYDFDFDFGTEPSLSASTTYWVVLDYTGRVLVDNSGIILVDDSGDILIEDDTSSPSASDYVQWGMDSSTPGYTDGEMKGEQSSVWQALSSDAIFEVYS